MKLVKTIICHFVEDCIRPLSGPLGTRARRIWYRRRLGGCGSNLTIDPGVILQNPQNIFLGDNVWIDINCLLTASPLRCEPPEAEGVARGQIRLGSDVHLGAGVLIQGHGGFTAGDEFAAAPGVKIFTKSNHHKESRAGKVTTPDRRENDYVTPIRIGKNVWIGLNCIMVGQTIGDDVFVLPNSVIFRSLPSNCLAGGNPATAKKALFPDKVSDADPSRAEDTDGDN